MKASRAIMSRITATTNGTSNCYCYKYNNTVACKTTTTKNTFAVGAQKAVKATAR